jgi:hypothetical protein
MGDHRLTRKRSPHRELSTKRRGYKGGVLAAPRAVSAARASRASLGTLVDSIQHIATILLHHLLSSLGLLGSKPIEQLLGEPILRTHANRPPFRFRSSGPGLATSYKVPVGSTLGTRFSRFLWHFLDRRFCRRFSTASFAGRSAAGVGSFCHLVAPSSAQRT